MTEKLYDSNKFTASGDTGFTRKKAVKQSNHDVYTIPSCMAPWADEPLYLVVARWGLQQKRWINRNDIAAVFHIPERLASFQLTYISRKKERVACRTRHVSVEGRGRQRVEIFIDHVLPTLDERHAPPRQRKVTSKRSGPTSRGVGSAIVENIGLWDKLLKGCREGHSDE